MRCSLHSMRSVQPNPHCHLIAIENIKPRFGPSEHPGRHGAACHKEVARFLRMVRMGIPPIPILCYPAKGGTFLVRDGHHRLIAYQKLHLRKVPVMVKARANPIETHNIFGRLEALVHSADQHLVDGAWLKAYVRYREA